MLGRGWGLVALVVLAAAACDGSASGTLAPTTTAGATPTTSTTAAATTTTEVPLSVIPPVIDLRYAQRVLDALAAIDGEAALEIYTQKKVTQRFLDLTSAVQERTALSEYRTQVFEAELRNGFVGWKSPPGAGVFTARGLLAARTTSPACFIVDGAFDAQPRYTTTVAPQTGMIRVFEKRNGTDPLGVNATQFQIVSTGSTAATDPKQLCA